MTPHALRSSGVKTRQMIIGNELVPVASLVELRLKNKSEVAELSHSIPRSHQKYARILSLFYALSEKILCMKNLTFIKLVKFLKDNFALVTRTFLHQAPRPDPSEQDVIKISTLCL